MALFDSPFLRIPHKLNYFVLSFFTQNSLLQNYKCTILICVSYKQVYTGPRSAVGNVSGNRCESDCRSRGRKFDPATVPYFRGD